MKVTYLAQHILSGQRMPLRDVPEGVQVYSLNSVGDCAVTESSYCIRGDNLMSIRNGVERVFDDKCMYLFLTVEIA